MFRFYLASPHRCRSPCRLFLGGAKEALVAKITLWHFDSLGTVLGLFEGRGIFGQGIIVLDEVAVSQNDGHVSVVRNLTIHRVSGGIPSGLSASFLD